MDEAAVLDASPTILLARAGFLDLLRVFETAVFSWAQAHPASLAVVNDLQARRCAEWLQIPTSGTVGIVLRAKLSGLVVAARPVLQRLISEGMHLSDRTMNAALLRVGE